MKISELDPPRMFTTGADGEIQISDCARIALEPDEQVTFTTPGGGEYDVARKDWGFYATPSLNGRLAQHGLRAVLGRNAFGKYYVFLVEKRHEPAFEQYLARERNEVVRWLDNDNDLAAVANALSSGGAGVPHGCMCGPGAFSLAHGYNEPPAGEVAFPRAAGTEYRREIFRCGICGHYVSVHRMHSDDFYGGAYVDATYGDTSGVRRNFERIISLPPDRSDNAGRVRRVLEFAARHLPAGSTPSVLDVGSGLCVFLHGMARAGWTCTALDPDPRAAAHARETVGVSAIAADFLVATDLGTYDVVTFNKVLEHVPDPIGMLKRAAANLNAGGFVYLELPDGEAAAAEGFGREEFFVEHFHIFSAASIALLAARAGFSVLALERLREPSTKYTLRAFLAPVAA